MGTEAIEMIHPRILQKAAKIIANGTHCEHSLMQLSAFIMEEDKLNELMGKRSITGTLESMKKAARAVLDDEHYAIISAICSLARSAIDIRNEFAHNSWGTVLGEPLLILLQANKNGVMASMKLEKHNPYRAAALSGGSFEAAHLRLIEQYEIDVYEESDLDSALSLANNANCKFSDIEFILRRSVLLTRGQEMSLGERRVREQLFSDPSFEALYRSTLRSLGQS